MAPKMQRSNESNKDAYIKASGKCINFKNSSLLFGKRVPRNLRQTIKDAQEIQNKREMGSNWEMSDDISEYKCNLFAFLIMQRIKELSG